MRTGTVETRGPERPRPEKLRQETLETWAREGNGSRRIETRVDWPLLLGGAVRQAIPRCPAANDSTRSGYWSAVLDAYDELTAYRDTSALLRRAVELSRSRLGLERAAVLLLTSNGKRLVGTWGTCAIGTTTNEQHIVFEAGTAHREAFALAEAGVARWLLLDNVPLVAHTASGTQVVGKGWNAIVPIRSGSRALGLLVCDSAITSRAPSEEQLSVASVFATLLGGLLQPSLEEPSQPASDTSPNPTTCSQLVLDAVRWMQKDPTISRERLARGLGVTPSRLGKRFKAELGETVVAYKNRLRLQRFRALVEPGGGNLLAAALDAGFGSYPQFHRVFRANTGCSPKEYFRPLIPGALPTDS